ncbi:MAG: SRPBCC domain-containing protein, partial [Gemmatimonadetes bacterium]|nr:SRPBCC domain-containing protein [Gemmatimonadota bacterium]
MEARLERHGSGYVLIVERQLDHPPQKVWRAVTERDALRSWFPCDVEGTWEPGAELQFTFLRGEGEG